MRTPIPVTTRDGWPEGSLLSLAETQVQSFRHARQCRRLELVEDYVELIGDLIDARGEARQVDIAARLGVAQPTVAKMLRRLADEGFTAQRPGRGVLLTEAGQDLARRSRLRHRTVECFLRPLGLSPNTARIDAEGMEHHVSPETLQAFGRFLSQKPAEAASRSRTGSPVNTKTRGPPS